MSGRLTTHVLDTAAGVPAAGLVIRLYRLEGEGLEHLKSVATNADGRLDAPLLDGAEMTAGVYELVFEVGAYLRARGADLPDPPFLDAVPLRFGVADAETHYHVPLLLSPFGYTTYKGS